MKFNTFDIVGLENLVVDDETTVESAAESLDTSMDFDSFISVLDGLLLDLGIPLEEGTDATTTSHFNLGCGYSMVISPEFRRVSIQSERCRVNDHLNPAPMFTVTFPTKDFTVTSTETTQKIITIPDQIQKIENHRRE